MEIIIYFCILYLSVLGLCEIVHFISLVLLDNKKRKNKVVLCLLKDDKAEMDLRFVAEQYDWQGRKYADRVFAVNFLPEGDVLSRCEVIAERYDIKIIAPNEICNEVY